MSSEYVLPPAPARLFLVGIGGIGMSALAQLLRWQGYDIAGSDRGISEPGKAELYSKLRQQGIRLYPQDGSGVRAETPQALIVSAAVEEGNPDFEAGADVPRLHRAKALSQALGRIPGARLIAVGGTCGKTSVTGWLGSALHALGERVLVVNGGYYADEQELPGNFRADANPTWLVVEVDESDKSILSFEPDYGIVLNATNDHYGADEMRRVFGCFLENCRLGGVASRELAGIIPAHLQKHALFNGEPCGDEGVISPAGYESSRESIRFEVPGFGQVTTCQAGRHSAANACAVLALLSILGLKSSRSDLCRALSAFRGIRQRFEMMGSTSAGIPVVNDYAHNPEKISAALRTAHERFGNRILAVFQPHGFTPLRKMRGELTQDLASLMKGTEDALALLPVYYAGGAVDFSPTSDEVAEEMAAAGIPVTACNRADVEKMAQGRTWDCILVMGARDSSLREWCRTMVL